MPATKTKPAVVLPEAPLLPHLLRQLLDARKGDVVTVEDKHGVHEHTVTWTTSDGRQWERRGFFGVPIAKACLSCVLDAEAYEQEQFRLNYPEEHAKMMASCIDDVLEAFRGNPKRQREPGDDDDDEPWEDALRVGTPFPWFRPVDVLYAARP